MDFAPVPGCGAQSRQVVHETTGRLAESKAVARGLELQRHCHRRKYVAKIMVRRVETLFKDVCRNRAFPLIEDERRETSVI